MCRQSGRASFTYRSIRSVGGMTASRFSYRGIFPAKTGSKLMMLSHSGTLNCVEVNTRRSRPNSLAWCATFWMNRETPLTSPKESVKRQMRTEGSGGQTPYRGWGGAGSKKVRESGAPGGVRVQETLEVVGVQDRRCG